MATAFVTKIEHVILVSYVYDGSSRLGDESHNLSGGPKVRGARSQIRPLFLNYTALHALLDVSDIRHNGP